MNFNAFLVFKYQLEREDPILEQQSSFALRYDTFTD